jgi:hypothetical protein
MEDLYPYGATLEGWDEIYKNDEGIFKKGIKIRFSMLG